MDDCCEATKKSMIINPYAYGYRINTEIRYNSITGEPYYSSPEFVRVSGKCPSCGRLLEVNVRLI